MATDGMGNSLDKIRRLALVSGVLLITYVVAGIAPSEGKDIAPLGIPFRLNRPDLVPFGLVLVCVYSALRFWLYAVANGVSPLRKRMGTWRRHRIAWNPSMGVYVSDIQYHEEAKADRLSGRLNSLYPKVFGKRAGFHTSPIEKSFTIETNEQLPKWIDYFQVSGHLPWQVRLGALLIDIDYFAPIWLNVVAVGLWVGSLYEWGARV